MKKLLYLGLSLAVLACGQETANQEQTPADDQKEETGNGPEFFGDRITEDGAVALETAVSNIDGPEEVPVKGKATIDEVCQKKGCWMDLDAGEAGYVTVKFKDYEFFVPKDAAGREAIVEGVAMIDTLSVEELRHYAEDAGEPDSVIRAITEPEITYSIVANGVIIK